MDLGLYNKTALVVGAGKGLGRAISLQLAQEGARVIAVSRTAKDLETLLSEMGGAIKGHQIISMDMMSSGSELELTKKIQASQIDVIVHNLGGTLGIKNPLCGSEELQKVMRFNLEIAVELNRFFIPLMQERGWGRVVHVSSNAAILGRGSSAYAVAKSALNTYTDHIGRAVAATGVTVSAVMPGAIRSPGIHWDNLANTKPADVEKYLNERVAIKRFAEPSEVAKFITYLCSEQAALFTGSVVTMDGGGF